MTQNQTLRLTDLPDEVIQAIIFYVPAKSAVALQLSCRRLSNLVVGPILWKEFVQNDFRWFDRRPLLSKRLRDPSFTKWKETYAVRHNSSVVARKALETIISNEVGKLNEIQKILDVGGDAKDVLMEAYNNSPSSSDHLARKYWSHAALGCLHRLMALQEWSAFKFRAENENGFERSLGALDLFILDGRDPGDLDDILDRLNSYAASVRKAHPAIDELLPRQRAIVIAEHLIQNQWTGIQDDRNYHSLDHLFLGAALFSDNRNSVPLISAVIFCYVARQFGLRAQPCSFPFHVYAVVQSPVGMDLDGNTISDQEETTLDDQTTIFMDPFRNSNPVPLAELRSQLKFIVPNSQPIDHFQFLRPASPRNLVLRAAHNIVQAPSHYQGPPLYPINNQLAVYAALFAMITFPEVGDPAQLPRYLALLTQRFLGSFEFDLCLFETYVLPMTTTFLDAVQYRDIAEKVRRADLQRPIPKLHSDPENIEIKYHVGQVFRHRRRDYLAVIYGWDSLCKMREDWIVMNQVDRLPQGRMQPFYNVLVEDESTRYVAEENVVLLSPQELTQDIPNSFPIEIGRWFKRFDVEKGEFISNIRTEYPED